MRVLYVSQYFPPEIGATQSRAWEMCRGLLAAGHSVTVVTGIPNHPVGRVHPDYRGRLMRPFSVAPEMLDDELLEIWSALRVAVIEPPLTNN